jgi:hypothetical protein
MPALTTRLGTARAPATTFHACLTNDDNNNYKTVSDFFVEDGSYLRCKLLQLGYTLPKSITKIFVARFSVSAQNLFTITNYTTAWTLSVPQWAAS